MLGRINNRQKKLLTCLVDGEGYVSMDQLMEEGDCSAKTVYRDVKQLQELGKVCGFFLTKRSKEGFWLEADSEVRNRLREELRHNRLILTEESVKRRRYKIYLDLLMCSPETTTIQKLSEQYYVGKTSIVNDLQKIEETANRAGLAMERTRNGTRIVGKEGLIRNEIASLMNTIRLSTAGWESMGLGRLDEDTRQMLGQIYGERDVHLVGRAIESIEMQLGRPLGDIYYINIITHLLITGQRIRTCQYINEESVIAKEEVDEEVYSVIRHELKKLGSFLNLVYPEIEMLFLYTHFSSAGYGELPNARKPQQVLEHLDKSTVDFCRELIEGIEANAEISLGGDESLLDYLWLHINSMLNRVRYNVKIFCPLKQQIIQEFSQTYLLIRKELLRMKKKYFPDRFISEDEICYLCLYFQSFIETENGRKRVLVVCSSGVGTSHFLKKRIEAGFPELEIADVISLKQLKSHDLRNIDFVVSTVRIREELPVAVVNVSILMDERDAAVLSNAIREGTGKERKKEMEIATVLASENIKLELKGSTKQAVLREMSELLFQNGHITDVDGFVDELNLREEEGITGIGEGIAIPHGKSPLVKKTVIVVGRNLSGIEWETFDDKPVRIVIMFAVRDVDESKHIMLLSRVAELLCDKEITKALLEASDEESIINILN